MTPWQAFTSEQDEGLVSALPDQLSSGSSPSSKPDPTEGIHPQDAAFSLTKRERDVLRLLAQGLTNAQIGERLVISSLTVNAHVRAIYRKLPVNSRVQAARYAQDHHLL